jgi:hypothetical protein
MTKLAVLSAAAAAVLAGLPLGTAEARINCDGNYQIVQGQLIATPYCQEQNLARVAQGYGMRVSFEAIRRSDSIKADVCRAIGHDNRVRETCIPFRNDGGPILRK